jgi:hypothetical protein
MISLSGTSQGQVSLSQWLDSFAKAIIFTADEVVLQFSPTTNFPAISLQTFGSFIN